MLSLLDTPVSTPSAPAISLAAIELNGKTLANLNNPAYQPTYLAACAAKLPPHIRYFRENCQGFPTAAGVPYNWSSNACSWIDTMRAQPFFGGYVLAPFCQFLQEANGWNATGEAQSRWRLRQVIDHLGADLKGLLAPGNECDNAGIAGGWTSFKQGGVTDEVALDRMLAMTRITREERGSSPVAILGPGLAFPTWTGGQGTFDMIDLLGRNGGEILNYLDGVDTHPHTASCTRWHNFDGSAPADGALSAHHVGRVLAQLGVQKPWTPFEGGYAWDNHETSGANARYRFGSHLCGLLRYAASWWALFCHAASSHDAMNISEATPPFAKRAWYDAATRVSEPTQYLRPANGQLTISNKSIMQFNDPPWFVLAPHTSTGFPTEFQRVSMNTNSILCMVGGRNIVARPVWLPDLATRTVKVNAYMTAAQTQAKLCVYGFDKLNMLAQVVQPVTGTGTWQVSFTPRLHRNPLIPDPNYVLVWLDHSGVGGPIEWTSPTIS